MGAHDELPPQPGPHEFGGVPVISETSEILDGSLSRRSDVEDLVFEVVSGFALGQELGVPNQVVAARASRTCSRRRPRRRGSSGSFHWECARRVSGSPDPNLENRSPVEFHLPGDGIQQRRLLVKAFVMAHVDPVAVRRVRFRSHDQRRPSLQIVMANQPDILCRLGLRIGRRRDAGLTRRRRLRAARRENDREKRNGSNRGSRLFTHSGSRRMGRINPHVATNP